MFGDSLWALRLPALVAGILVVPATYAAVRLLYGPMPALMAGAIVATSGELIAFSANARGYSLLTLDFLVLIVICALQLRRERAEFWIAFATLAALGLWTIPLMLYPLGAVSVWFALTRLYQTRTLPSLRGLTFALLGCAGITALCYAPVVQREGMSAVTSNGFVLRSLWPEFFKDIAGSFYDTLFAWRLGTPMVIALASAACALLALVVHRRVARHAVGLPHSTMVWCALLFLINPRALSARMWQWFLPLAAGLAGAGLVYATLGQSRRIDGDSDRRFARFVTCYLIITGVTIMLPAY